MPITWKNEFSVGVKEIDNQHQVFISILNNLCDCIHGDEKVLPKDVLKRLSDYAAFHFATEENYFDKFGYEFSNEHKTEHKELKAKVNEFVERFDKEGNGILVEVLDFMEDWLVNHLIIQDRKYMDYMKRNGIV